MSKNLDDFGVIDPRKVKKLEPKEKTREVRLKIATEKAGGYCLKYYNKGDTDWPDRIIVLPDGVIWWVELKKPGKKPRPLQIERGNILTSLGHNYILLDSDDKLTTFITKHLQPIWSEKVNWSKKVNVKKSVKSDVSKYF